MTTPSGQQPPGGNPYQQPGYTQGNPYRQPTESMHAAPTAGAFQEQVSLDKPSDTPAKKGSRWKMAGAVTFSVLLVGGVTTAGVMTVVNAESGETTAAANGDDPTGENPGDVPNTEEEPPDDPRGSVRQRDPVVDDDWQVRVHRERHVEYDVPADWVVHSETLLRGWEVESEDEEEPVPYLIAAPATYLDEFCGENTMRAMVGVTGARGAVDTEEAAEHHASTYARAAYDQDLEGDATDQEAEPFSNEHGFEGHIAISEVENVPLSEDDDEACTPTSGRVISIGYTDSTGEILTWMMTVDTGVEDELEQETIDLISGSLRTFEE